MRRRKRQRMRVRVGRSWWVELLGILDVVGSDFVTQTNKLNGWELVTYNKTYAWPTSSLK